MKTTRTPAPADLQRWSEEIARNPGSLAFLPLARAYRRLQRSDLALKLCLRGLEQHPDNVEAHALLALLHLEAGDRARASDEWSIVLRLKPGNFEALRGMGFRHLEQNDIPLARQHLERAALIRPDDTTVQEALRLLGQRAAASRAEVPPPAFTRPAQPGAAQEPDAAPAYPDAPEFLAEPWLPDAAPEPAAGPGQPDRLRSAPAPVSTAPQLAASSRSPADGMEDPSRIFDELLRGGPLIGALLLDHRGLVLAGNLGMGTAGRPDDLGAILGAAIDEATRTVTYLDLGNWRTLLLESDGALVHVAPAADDAIVVLAARTGTPAGWLVRAAGRAADLATRFLGEPR